MALGIAAHIAEIPRNPADYEKGNRDYHNGAQIVDCPTYGTTREQAAWLAGWLDALADQTRGIRR